jgi:hypothetical protein
MTPALFPRTMLNLVLLAGSATALVSLHPLQPWMTPALQPLVVSLSASWGLWRLWHLHRHLRPWWAWRHGAPWVLDPFRLPRPTAGMLLGRGFRWMACHTQQLEDALREAGALPLDRGPRGGYAALHAVGKPQEELLRLPWTEVARHLLLTGSPGSGKTVAFQLLATEAIRRRPGAVLIIDPKPSLDLVTQARQAARKVGRPWALVSPVFPHLSATMNVLDTAQTTTEVADRVRALMPGGGDDRDPFYTQYPLALIEHVATVQQALGQRWTLEGLYRDTVFRASMDRLLLAYLQHLGVVPTNPAHHDNLKAHKAAYAAMGLHDLPADLLIEDSDHDVDHFRKVTSNLIPAFRGVVGHPYGGLFSAAPADVTWDVVAEDEMVVYLAIPSMLLGDLGNRIFRIVCQDLIGFLGWRYALQQAQTATPFTVLVDELRQILYPQFNTALAMSREAQCAWMLAQQSHADTELALGPAAARVLFDNCYTKLYFQGADRQTAQTVAEGFGTGEVLRPQPDGVRLAYGDTGGLSGGMDQRLGAEQALLIRQEWLGGLPKGHFFAQMLGTVWKGEVPLLHTLPWETVTASEGTGLQRELLGTGDALEDAEKTDILRQEEVVC